MTVPVHANLGGGMQFFLGSDAPESLEDTGSVSVVEVPARTVVSMGDRGSYSADNVAETRRKLSQWIADSGLWRQVGEPYAVFWNGPFVPGFLKRYEVHVPVESLDTSPVSMAEES